MKTRFIILASGRGRNAAVLLDHAAQNSEFMQIVGLVSDRAEAMALEEARRRKIETFVISHQNEGALLALFERLKPDWALLAGYKRKVGENFLRYFWDKEAGYFRVVNIHPSLLPAFPGLHGYKQAFSAGVKVSGVTVHLVDQGLDTGLPILQEPLERLESDSLVSFEERGLRIEHRLFCRALDLIAKRKLKLNQNPDQDGYFVSLEGGPNDS